MGLEVTRKYRLPPAAMLRNKSSNAGLPQANRDWSPVAGILKKTMTPED